MSAALVPLLKSLPSLAPQKVLLKELLKVAQGRGERFTQQPIDSILKDLRFGMFLLLAVGTGVRIILRGRLLFLSHPVSPFPPLACPPQFFLQGSERKVLLVTRPILLQVSSPSISSKHVQPSPRRVLLSTA